MNYLGEFFTVIFPTFAAFASLQEIIRVSVAASPRQDLRGEIGFTLRSDNLG
jgi:hypothetical protein